MGRESAEKYWEDASIIRIWQGEIQTSGGKLDYKSAKDFSDSEIKIYLGEIEGKHYFVVHKEIPEGNALTLRELANDLPKEVLEIVVTALALINWHETHLRCSRCGNETVIANFGWTRKCIVDETQHFPRTDPAIIVSVQDRNGRLCLGRQASWPENRFSNIAGFVEPGETLEMAVTREVFEESSLKVEDIKYLYSQPWPFPNSLMLAFEAFTDQPEIAKPDGVEIVELRWFTKEQIREELADGRITIPPTISVSRKMIDMWLNG